MNQTELLGCSIAELSLRNAVVMVGQLIVDIELLKAVILRTQAKLECGDFGYDDRYNRRTGDSKEV